MPLSFFHKLRSCHVLSASLFSMCQSLLWIWAVGPSILTIGELCVTAWEAVCVCVCVHVALRALCWFCSAVSVTHWVDFVGVPWFPSCCVYSFCLLPKNTLKSITLLSLSFPLYFPMSVDLSYLLLTSLDLLFQTSSCVVVRWRASQQLLFASPAAGDRVDFPFSHPASHPFAWTVITLSFFWILDYWDKNFW